MVTSDYEGPTDDYGAGRESGKGTLDAIRAAEHALGLAPKSTPVGLLGYSGGLGAIAGVLICGGVLAVAAAHTESLLPESIRPVPHALAGAFAGLGLNLHVGGAIAALALMFGSYALVVARASRLPGASMAVMCRSSLLAPLGSARAAWISSG